MTHRDRGAEVPELRSFVRGLRKAYQAGKAGLTLEWGNGPTEGHVSKLKLDQATDVRAGQLCAARANAFSPQTE